MEITLRTLDAEAYIPLIPSLSALLKDAVDRGASLGFLPPLSIDEAAAYWYGIARDVHEGARCIVVASRSGEIIGVGQLVLPSLAAQRHRAEVQKLCVTFGARGQGVGRRLMEALHREAARRDRSLLVLTTRRDEYPQLFYQNLGYALVGVIPGYTIDRAGERYDTAILCRCWPRPADARDLQFEAGRDVGTPAT